MAGDSTRGEHPRRPPGPQTPPESARSQLSNSYGNLVTIAEALCGTMKFRSRNLPHECSKSLRVELPQLQHRGNP